MYVMGGFFITCVFVHLLYKSSSCLDLHHCLVKQRKLKSRMILQVHDELVFECFSNEEEEMRELVKKEMEEVMPLKVPLLVDMGWGENWNDAH